MARWYGYVGDPAMARRYEFSAHAQVLVRYSGFDGGACVVPPLEARLAATLPDARGMVVDALLAIVRLV